MPKPTSRKAKQDIRGSSRKPGPIGIDIDELFGHHDLWEESDNILDPSSIDWIEVHDKDGDPARVFYKGALLPGVKPDAPLQIDFAIQVQDMDDRGEILSQLFLEFGVYERTKGRFSPYVSKTTMKSAISVRPRSRFDSLVDFKPHYDEFLKLIATTGSRSAAFRDFANRHVGKIQGHVSTDFTGKRAKTVEHEVYHMRYSQEKATALLENMMGEIKSEGKKSNGLKAWPRIRRIVEQMTPGWDADQGDAFHRRMAEHDCLVMIAIYEAFALTREEAKAAGNSKPIADLYELLDYLTLELMNTIGEPIETWHT